MRSPITITDSAKRRVLDLMHAKEGDSPLALRIGLETKGCSGLRYKLSYAYDTQPFDEKVVMDDLLLLIDPKALMYVLGTEMDFEETDTASGFIFRNPNEKGKCGCGESFHV